MLKPIVAVPGDHVHVGERGIEVNGVPIIGSARLERDSKGRPLPAISHGSYHLGPNAVWALSVYHTGSFDSRYFGVSVRSILGIAKRL